jgi:hypothetical protein
MKYLNSFSSHNKINEYNSGSSNKMIGNNPDFVVIFNTEKQKYDVYYKGKLLISREKYADIKSYLD